MKTATLTRKPPPPLKVRTTRAAKSSQTLDGAVISLIKGMLHRGDAQMDIAAVLGLNQGRVAEVNGGKHGAPTIPMAPLYMLPSLAIIEHLREFRALHTAQVERWIKTRR